MSTNERSELARFQGNSDGKSKCETKFILAEEKKKREENISDMWSNWAKGK